jgi:teichuronic acid biosynthesis glycosyltransferase TuaC
VLVVSEFYPSRRDPVLGIWAHRQALAARAAGAEILVVHLHRLVPPRAAAAGGPATAARELLARVAEPPRQRLDGIPVIHLPFVSPPREPGYPRWGAWAAPVLAPAMRILARSFRYELVHAHNAIPSGDAVLRAGPRVPVVVSVHGGDVLYTAPRWENGRRTVARTLAGASEVIANSAGIAEMALAAGAGRARVVHLGADLPDPPGAAVAHVDPPTLVTVAHLVARKRHADVLRAQAVLSARHPSLRYVIVGDGPERAALEALARRLDIADRVEFRGQLAPGQVTEVLRASTLYVLPSTEEAFGVAYIEAMAAGLPAIGCRGEPGPEEIAAAGDGFILVPPGDIERLSQRIGELLSDRARLLETGRRARATVAAGFTWERCGTETLAAYAEALA